MKFSNASFDPELFSFRLVHDKYDMLSQPVKVAYSVDEEMWKCIVDLGDPKTIQPFSDVYKLEIIIADERLASNVRSTIATIRVNFRHSITEDHVPNANTPISYKPENIIRTNPPE
jgi:hypothetical protein